MRFHNPATSQQKHYYPIHICTKYQPNTQNVTPYFLSQGFFFFLFLGFNFPDGALYETDSYSTGIFGTCGTLVLTTHHNSLILVHLDESGAFLGTITATLMRTEPSCCTFADCMPSLNGSWFYQCHAGDLYQEGHHLMAGYVLYLLTGHSFLSTTRLSMLHCAALRFIPPE